MVSQNGRKIGSVEGGDAKKTKGLEDLLYSTYITESAWALVQHIILERLQREQDTLIQIPELEKTLYCINLQNFKNKSVPKVTH